jgi:hypothetical protein
MFFFKENKESDEIFENIIFVKIKSSKINSLFKSGSGQDNTVLIDALLH